VLGRGGGPNRGGRRDEEEGTEETRREPSRQEEWPCQVLPHLQGAADENRRDECTTTMGFVTKPYD